MLTPKKRLFAAEYAVDKNATRAAQAAGYSERTAKSQGSRLLTDVDVQGLIAKHAQDSIEAAGMKAETILAEVGRLATVDMRDFFDQDGNFIPIKDWTPAMGAQVAGVEVIIKNAKAGDGHTDEVLKLKLWDKPKTQHLSMQHLGLATQQVEQTGEIRLVWEDSEGEQPQDIVVEDVTPSKLLKSG